MLATWRMALGHRPGEEGGAEIVRPYSMGSSIPAGGVNMSMDNMLRYAPFHMGQTGSEHDGVVSPAGRQLMREPQIAKAPTRGAMGLGWHLRTVGGVPTFAHGGSAGAGHRRLLELVPERNLAFAIFTNHTEGWRLAQIVEHAVRREIEGSSLEPNQLIAHRGANEDVTLHATPLEARPDAPDYLGS